MNRKAFAVLAILVASCGQIADSQNVHSSEQSQFSAEDHAVQKPVPIPRDALAILKQDEQVRAALEFERIPVAKIPLAWFSASAIHLGHSQKVDLVVVGVKSLRGANVSPFWVFRASARGYELVLNASAHDLSVEDTRRNRYRDITLISVTANTVSTVWCRFDGTRYAVHKSTLEPIR